MNNNCQRAVITVFHREIPLNLRINMPWPCGRCSPQRWIVMFDKRSSNGFDSSVFHCWFSKKKPWTSQRTLAGRHDEPWLRVFWTEALKVGVHFWYFFFFIYNVAAHQCDLKVWGNGTDRDVICSYRLFINPKWFPIIPHRGCIYYIWNSVVFPFNTESKKKKKKNLSVPTDRFMEIIPIKCQTHAMIMYILFSWHIPRTRMTEKIVFQKRRWNEITSQVLT